MFDQVTHAKMIVQFLFQDYTRRGEAARLRYNLKTQPPLQKKILSVTVQCGVCASDICVAYVCGRQYLGLQECSKSVHQ